MVALACNTCKNYWSNLTMLISYMAYFLVSLRPAGRCLILCPDSDCAPDGMGDCSMFPCGFSERVKNSGTVFALQNPNGTIPPGSRPMSCGEMQLSSASSPPEARCRKWSPPPSATPPWQRSRETSRRPYGNCSGHMAGVWGQAGMNIQRDPPSLEAFRCFGSSMFDTGWS